MSKKIVHLSQTPLVGAPGKISKYLNYDENFRSVCFIFSDYPGVLANFFLENSIVVKKEDSLIYNYFIECVEQADIIHIHNDINDDVRKIILNYGGMAKKIYHVHSVIREGPLYCRKYLEFDFEIIQKIVVSHIHTRLYPDFLPVPNLIDAYPSVELYKNNKPKILYSPTHNRNEDLRYGNKFTKNILNSLNRLNNSGKAEVIFVEKPISPGALLSLRRNMHISIDEIATGGFHQVSLESLCCGNVTINNADYFACGMFSNIISNGIFPPFYRCNDDDLIEKIIEIVDDNDILVDLQKRSYEYYRQYLVPDKLINVFKDIYKEILGNEV